MATHGLPTWPWVDTPADELPPAERLLLEGVRIWAGAARQGHSPLPALRLAYIPDDAAGAIAPLDALLRSLASAKALTASCPLCPRVAPQEAMLLLGCALAQRGARREALALMLRYLSPATAYGVMLAAIHLGIALARAGLLLQNPLRCRRRQGGTP
jgi:hypothetical protein